MNPPGRQHKRKRPKKARVRIPKDIKDRILVACLHCCCICKQHATQINHIDRDRSNWAFENLIPLCPSCHAKVHTNYAMTQGYTASQLRIYRDEWIETCRTLRVVAAAQITLGDANLELRSAVKSLDKRLSSLEGRNRS